MSRPNSYQEVSSTWRRNGSNTVPPSVIVDAPFGVGLLSAVLFNQTSVNTVGYRQYKRKLLPAHPYSLKDEAQYRYHCVGVKTIDVTKSTGNVQTLNYTGSSDLVGLSASYTDVEFPCDDPSFAALTKLYSSISLSKGNALVSLAEAGKTASMVAQAAIKLASAFSALRKGDLGGCANVLGISVKRSRIEAFRRTYSTRGTGYTRVVYKLSRGRKRKVVRHYENFQQFAASTWLELSYGWKPLIRDVYSQAENLANYMTNKSSVVRVAKSSATSSRQHSKTVFSSGGGHKTYTEARVSKTVRYVARFSIPDGANSAANVFGLTNPALVAWEVIPYSFVVDWFLPVSTYLESLTATQGLSLWEMTMTTRVKADVRRTWSPTGKPEVDTVSRRLTYVGSASAYGYVDRKDRSILSVWPGVPLPPFKSPLSFSHMASSIALLQNAFIGRRKTPD